MPTIDSRGEKSSVHDNDVFLISDSEDTLKSKKVKKKTIKAGMTDLIFHRDNLIIAKNSTNPPSVKANTNILVNGKIVKEDVDRGFSWNSGNFPAQSDGTWYLYCSGLTDAEQVCDVGVYGASKTETPVWDESKRGWYSAGGYRILARFVSTSGTISELMEYSTMPVGRGYYEGKGVYLNGNALTMQRLSVDIGGKAISYKEDVVLKTDITTGLTASTWYAGIINEATGAISYVTIATLSSWTGHTLASNKLNILSIYDQEKKYCAANDGATYYRVVFIFYVNAAGNALQFLFDVKKIPPIYLLMYNKNQSIANATNTVIGFDNNLVANGCIDTVSGSSGSTTTWKFTAPIGGKYRVSCMIISAAVVWPAAKTWRAILGDGVQQVNGNIQTSAGGGTFSLSSVASHCFMCKPGATIQAAVLHDQGGSVATLNSDQYSYISIEYEGE